MDFKSRNEQARREILKILERQQQEKIKAAMKAWAPYFAKAEETPPTTNNKPSE